MIPTCLDCYRKHIGTANAYENESPLGYPSHKWLAIGEICAAEHEVLKKYPELAEITRNYRKEFMEKNIPFPTLDLIELANQLEIQEIKEKEEAETINNSKETGINQ